MYTIKAGKKSKAEKKGTKETEEEGKKYSRAKFQSLPF